MQLTWYTIECSVNIHFSCLEPTLTTFKGSHSGRAFADLIKGSSKPKSVGGKPHKITGVRIRSAAIVKRAKRKREAIVFVLVQVYLVLITFFPEGGL